MKKDTRYIKEYILGRKITINYNIEEILLLDNKIIEPAVKRKLRKLNLEVDVILKDTLKDISKKEQKEIIEKVIIENNKEE